MEEKEQKNLKRAIFYTLLGATALIITYHIGRSSKTKTVVTYRAPFPSEITAAYNKGYVAGINSVKDGVKNTVASVFNAIKKKS